MKKSELKNIIKEVLTENENLMVGDVQKLARILNNQLVDLNDAPKLEFKVENTKEDAREYAGKSEGKKDIKLTIEQEDLIFVFSPEGKLRYIVNYKD